MGERVAAMMPNIPETIISSLACSSLGGVWASCSPDFGENAILDRFKQIEPKILITCDYYFYNGKKIQIIDKASEVVKKIPSIKETLILSQIYLELIHQDYLKKKVLEDTLAFKN